MIISVEKLPEETEEDRQYKQLIEDFNKISAELGLKFYLKIEYSCPKLFKPFFWKIGNTLGDHTIFYSDYSKTFTFIKGIDEETFNEIKPILEKINQQFKIEVI